MDPTWNRSRAAAVEATQILLEVLEDDDADDARLLHAYLDAKRRLASTFRIFAISLVDEPNALEQVISQLEWTMAALYPFLDARHRRVRAFGPTHRLLYGYLKRRLDTDVDVDEIRILTGDAVHTERRLRELRELGLEIVMGQSGGIRTCNMSSKVDLAAAASAIVRREVEGDATLSDIARQAMLERVDCAD